MYKSTRYLNDLNDLRRALPAGVEIALKNKGKGQDKIDRIGFTRSYHFIHLINIVIDFILSKVFDTTINISQETWALVP